MSYWQVLYWLLIGHAIADYVWQVPFKSPWRNPDLYPDEVYGPWWWGMLAHSAINGAFVSLLTGSIAYGMVETVAHFLLDTGKCRGNITALEDQVGHILSKVILAGFYVVFQ